MAWASGAGLQGQARRDLEPAGDGTGLGAPAVMAGVAAAAGMAAAALQAGAADALRMAGGGAGCEQLGIG